MDNMQAKINELIQASKKVLFDCSLENGAIVAGNPGSSIYLKDSPNYFYVWPRDAAFISIAFDILGMHKQAENFFTWCLDRGCDKDGMLWQHYVPNGVPAGFFISELYNPKETKKVNKYIHPHACYPITKALRSQLQPDGNGLVLWALENHIRHNKKAKEEFKDLAYNLAYGISSIWSKSEFKYLIHDPWEEKIGYPGVNLTYDVAVSISGLEFAEKIYGQNEKWTKTKKQMIDSMQEAICKDKYVSAIYGPKYKKENYKKLFSKIFSVGQFDPEIDASLFSLIWPTMLVSGKKAENILKYLAGKLDRNGGIIRYPGDSYDGIMIQGSSFRKGGNAWPFLNFWVAICLNKIGLKDDAVKYYKWVIDRVDDYIPEQIDSKGIHRGPSPLSWSHAMFIIASKELGYLSI